MKVICAGFPKTGTKSLARALRILGYNAVYDYPESLEFAFEEWESIFSGKSNNIDAVINKVYANGVDAVVDLPHSFFFEHFFKRNPDAKVILMLRDEEKWFESFKQMLEEVSTNHPFMRFIVPHISPTSLRFLNFHKDIFNTVAGSSEPNKLKWTSAYRRHNAYVKSVIPQDQLLIYRVSEGWKPICDFLGKEVPEDDFPFENKAGTKDTIGEYVLEKTRIVKQIKREVVIRLCMLPIIFALLIFVVSIIFA